MPISIVLALIQKCIIYHQIMEIMFDLLLLYQIVFVSVFPLVNMHLLIVLCCGTERTLFINKISKQLCQIMKFYLCTKFSACKYSG